MLILKVITLLKIMVLLLMLLLHDTLNYIIRYIYIYIYICRSNIPSINIYWATLFNSTLHLVLNDVAFTLIAYVKTDQRRVIEYALKTKTS